MSITNYDPAEFAHGLQMELAQAMQDAELPEPGDRMWTRTGREVHWSIEHGAYIVGSLWTGTVELMFTVHEDGHTTIQEAAF